MSAFSIPNIPNSKSITALDILTGLLGYRITELTLNLKSTDAEWASVTMF
jgi:5-enolpyruvylshikimate-3-phosphate synthase